MSNPLMLQWLRVLSEWGNTQSISLAQLKQREWMENAKLMVLPGGRDIPYLEDFNEQICNDLSEFVQRGGSFLGVCAGAYFSSRSICFAKGTAHEVSGHRPLCFFPGQAVGPLGDVNFTYDAKKSVQALPFFDRDGDGGFIYYHGGCCFESAPWHKDVVIDMRVFDPEAGPIVSVRREVQRGKIVLTGGHFEYDPHVDVMRIQDHHPEVYTKMMQSNVFRMRALCNMMKYLVAKR